MDKTLSFPPSGQAIVGYDLMRDPTDPSAPIPETQADLAERLRYEQERRYVLSSAQCLLWYADIFEIGQEELEWRMHFPDAEAAQRFLPIALQPEADYAASWYEARLPEDQLTSNHSGNTAVRRGENYHQDFRCRRLDGEIRWLHEEVRIETVVPHKQWRAVGVCTDITTRKQAEIERERLHEIAAAINAAQGLDDILLKIRNTMVEVRGFDRAGVFRVEGERVYGSWGTDAQGRLEDNHHVLESLSDWGPHINDLVSGASKFYIEEYPEDVRPPGTEGFSLPHAVVSLQANGELVGLLSVDNLLTGRPVVAENVLPLLPFAEHAAVAIFNTRLLAERARHLERQRRLTTVAAAICSSTALHEILHMVRDGIVNAGGFDRAAVFLFDRERGLLCGTWGTDRQGHSEDISYQQFPVVAGDPMPMQRVALGELDYYLTADFSRECNLPPDDSMAGVHAHAIVPLRADGTVVGVVVVDNLLRDAPITEEDITGILPFYDQAAVAIQNARLFEELRQAQTALVASEKLRAVGELASGVAHNVNNMLAAVLGYAELIQSAEGATDEIQHYAQTIERAALDGAEIVRRMQHFARKETAGSSAAFDLAELTGEAIELTRPAWLNQAAARGAKIDVVVSLAQGLWVLGIASELREVLVNLIKNAVDAMSQGGTLTIRGYTEGEQAVFEVVDTGIGMDEATRQRIFEPFFTTKGTGKGTGLGLSVAWGIVKRHQGQIEVQSMPGQGTTLQVRLPLTRVRPAALRIQSSPLSLSEFRLLLVEDDEMVRSGLAQALMTTGASIAVTGSAREAQQWLDANASQCDLILSDHGMMGQTGLELLAQVRRQFTHIRRVLLSGWGADVPGEVDTSAAELILNKPISREKLISALSHLLSTPAKAD